MTRQRLFLEMNVVEAAKERLRHTYNTFDQVWLQFSGGKDSTACLYLMKEIHEELGLGPVNVIFRDEEMVSPAVVEFVEWVFDQPWVNGEWYCLPQGQEIWVLGRREYVLLWSEERRKAGRLVRDIPKNAITAKDFGLDPGEPIPAMVDFYTMQGKKGSVAFVTGVRANESMIRYRSLVQKLHENYIVKPYKLPPNIPLKFSKVIYDWTTDDVLKYIDEQGGRYCEFYDYAAVAGANARVGIPLHSVAIRRISDVVRTEPEFYDRLVTCFPQIDAQRRYWKDFNIEKLILDYAADGWDGVRQCIQDNMLTPGLESRAMSYSAAFRKKHALDPYSYPIEWLIRNLLLNEFHATAVNPIGPGTRAHAVRQAQIEADANSLDIQDDGAHHDEN